MRLTLSPQFSRASWRGRGPHESYPDRKQSAHVNVHQRDVDAMHFPYMVPGECGGAADVQWVALQDPSSGGSGLLLQYWSEDKAAPVEQARQRVEQKPAARPAGMKGAQVSASRWMPATIASASHDFQLPRPGGED